MWNEREEDRHHSISPAILIHYLIFEGVFSFLEQQSAKIAIPKNVQHGDHMHCSHALCREQGIKFCYCSFCEKPVAIQNFRIRHHHCEEWEKKKQEQKQQRSVAAAQNKRRDTLTSNGSRKRLVSRRAADERPCKASRPGSGSGNSLGIAQVDVANGNTETMNAESLFSNRLLQATADTNSQAGDFWRLKNQRRLSQLNSNTLSEWGVLLLNRPQIEEGPELTQWLQTVVEVSGKIVKGP